MDKQEQSKVPDISCQEPEAKVEEEKKVDKSVPIQSFDWILEPSQQNKGGLGLCNYIFVKNVDNLDKLKIGAVISVFGETELVLDGSISHFRIRIDDSPSQNIKCFFETAIKFISENITKTNVLVHCKAGVSRSATVIASYLMKTKKMSSAQALKMLKSRRSLVDPNRGFVKQLRQYDRELQKERQNENCIIY